jgi:long-chain acyl-CoA synthetase
VLLCDESSPEWVAVLLGIWRAGAIAVPVDPKATEIERRAITERCTPRFVIADACALTREEVVGDFRADAACSMSDPALIVWTSGTTGKPKGVTLTFGNIAYDVSAAVMAQQLAPTDRWLSVLPLHHMLELSCAVLCCLTVGAELSFAKTLMPGEIVALMQERETTHMMTVPMLLRLLGPAIAQAGVTPHALFVGGAPLPAGTIESYADIGIPVYQGYGLSETSPLVTANSPDHDRPGSVGRALPGTQIRVDELGELHVRSPAVMAGYWDDHALTNSVLKDGWFATGDLGFVDADGFVFVTGRAKNLIVLESGKNVQPEEVETALHASSMFAEVCVVGVRAKGEAGTGAEEVCAVVVPTHPLSHDDAAAEVARATAILSGFKRPTVVIVSETELPKSAKRSILRSDVAAAAMARLAAR